MAHLRNIQSGAVVSVSDETAARLGAEWQPVETPKPAPKRAKKSDPEPTDSTESD